MNWLEKISYVWSVPDILNSLIAPPSGTGEKADITWAFRELQKLQQTDPGICGQIAEFGAMPGEANSIASTLMRSLKCEDPNYPEAPGVEDPAQQGMIPMDMSEIGQEKPMSMPSVEIG